MHRDSSFFSFIILPLRTFVLLSICSLLSSPLVRLNLQGNWFYGSIPEEIGMLRHLQELQLQENSLQGNLPMTLTTMNNLGECRRVAVTQLVPSDSMALSYRRSFHRFANTNNDCFVSSLLMSLLH